MRTHLREVHEATPDSVNMIVDESLATRGPPASYYSAPPIVRDSSGFRQAIDRSKSIRQRLVDEAKEHHESLRVLEAPINTDSTPISPPCTSTAPSPYRPAAPPVSAREATQPSNHASFVSSHLGDQSHPISFVHESPKSIKVELPAGTFLPSMLPLDPIRGHIPLSDCDDPGARIWPVYDSSTGACIYATQTEIEAFCDKYRVHSYSNPDLAFVSVLSIP